MEYQYLDVEQQKAMVEARLRQLENEHYAHSRNKASAKDDESIAAADEAMATIDAAYALAQTELATLTAPKKEKK